MKQATGHINLFQSISDRISRSGYWLIGLVIVLPLIAYIGVYWYEHKYNTLPIYAKNNLEATGVQDAATLPAFSFTDQNQHQFGSAAIKNKITIAHFFFASCPSICPKMMREMERVQDKYGKDEDVMLLSFTVDPEHDTPERLCDYGKVYKVGDKWKLLTGDKKTLYWFARKGLYITATDGDGGPTDFIHSDRIVLLDHKQQIRGYYNGTSDKEVNLLINDIKKLKNEAN
ncbi:SCO family protein [Chitinophagaceae bacterium LWZ2-11]